MDTRVHARSSSHPIDPHPYCFYSCRFSSGLEFNLRSYFWVWERPTRRRHQLEAIILTRASMGTGLSLLRQQRKLMQFSVQCLKLTANAARSPSVFMCLIQTHCSYFHFVIRIVFNTPCLTKACRNILYGLRSRLHLITFLNFAAFLLSLLQSNTYYIFFLVCDGCCLLVWSRPDEGLWAQSSRDPVWGNELNPVGQGEVSPL